MYKFERSVNNWIMDDDIEKANEKIKKAINSVNASMQFIDVSKEPVEPLPGARHATIKYLDKLTEKNAPYISMLHPPIILYNSVKKIYEVHGRVWFYEWQVNKGITVIRFLCLRKTGRC